MPPKGSKRRAGGRHEPPAADAAASESSEPRILLVNSGPVWLEVSAEGKIHLNRIFGPGVTLQTVPSAALPTQDPAFIGATATATAESEVSALLPGADGCLEVAVGGAYNCVRLIGAVRPSA